MAIIKHKRGMPFDGVGQWLNDFGNPINLTTEGITVFSQIRHPVTDALIASLTVTRPTATSYCLTADDTTDWPLDRLAWDIIYKFTDSRKPSVTETHFVDVEYNPTRLP